METIRFGKTGLTVSRTGFGAIPIQRLSIDEAVELLQKAYECGITIFDTARNYTDSEYKIGTAFEGLRKGIVICTKTQETQRDAILKSTEKSLSELRSAYIDIFQFHNPKTVPLPGSDAYDTVSELKKQGVIRHIGFSNHDLKLVKEAVSSGFYETVQFPLSPLSSAEDFQLAELCKKYDVGLLAMKALAGGIITKAVTSFVTLRVYSNIVPIWGIQKMAELEEIIGFENNPPEMTEEIERQINKDREEFCGAFCRSCGYCLPCQAEIPIPMASKISYFVFRAPYEEFFSPEWRGKMDRIKNCIQCGSCMSKCPYKLDVPALLQSELKKYDVLYDQYKKGLPFEKPV